MNKAIRVERHIIKENDKHYRILDDFCFKSKNLYNFANYHIRKEFVENNSFISYVKMDKLMKQEGKDLDYRNMPSAQSAQQCLKLLEKNWKSFFSAIKDWNKNKDKYTGRPKLPKYLKKNGRNILILTNANCKHKDDGYIHFPKTFDGYKLKTKIEGQLQQVRILPRNKYVIVEVVYKFGICDLSIDNGKYMSIDIGLDNFATIVNNVGEMPVIINGKGLKSINKQYNKLFSHYRKVSKNMNGLEYTNRINVLTIKRNNRISDFIHKASKYTIDYAQKIGCNTIIVGNNKDWKRDSVLSKKINQSFVGIPHQLYINQLIYKAENVGITVITTEESYTSKCSFLDMEEIKKKLVYKGKRINRGLFKSYNGTLINADVNGAYNIMRKVFPNVFSEGVEGVGLHPIRVNCKVNS